MKSPRVGALREVIQIRRATLVDDGSAETEVFADHGSTIRAKKTDLSDGEQWRASQVAAKVSSRFIVQGTAFTRDLTPADQIRCKALDYEITGIKEVPDTNGRFLEINVVRAV